jgi:hypothetical protein
VPAESVKANFKFLADLDAELVYVPSKGGGDETEHVGNFTMREVEVHDARRELLSSNLDVEGFQLVHQPTTVTDFYDDAQVDSTWHDEVKALLVEVAGASRVEIFDDTRRSSSLEQQQRRQIREPADIVHNDYTARSGIKRLRDYFADDPDETERLLEGRFAIINVWRSIAGPVMNHPLALCDATSVKPEHLVAVERRAEERIGELQTALYDQDQRWYYYPELLPDEALLIKTFDSETSGPTRFTIHTSFAHPRARGDAPPRESIETRCMVFF